MHNVSNVNHYYAGKVPEGFIINPSGTFPEMSLNEDLASTFRNVYASAVGLQAKKKPTRLGVG